MKLFLFSLLFLISGCSAILPYKGQDLTHLYKIQQTPDAYKNAVVAFEGEVLGVRESAQEIHLVLKIDAPLYYYATGKGGSLAYELLLVQYIKTPHAPSVSPIKKGEHLKTLARVDGYQTSSNLVGKPVGAVRLKAISLAARSSEEADLCPPTTSADYALYQSWKEGKLFFEQSPQDLLEKDPAK